MGKEPPDKVIRSRLVPQPLSWGREPANHPNHHLPLLCHRLDCSTLLLCEVPSSDPSKEGSDPEMSSPKKLILSQNEELNNDA